MKYIISFTFTRKEMIIFNIIIIALFIILICKIMGRNEKYVTYVESTGPYCNDLLCGNKKIGWDCCNNMACPKGLYKCCSRTGSCECCDKYNQAVY